MTILVDCRCLNYPYFTGINAYTVRLLHCLYQLKNKNNKYTFVALGIQSDRFAVLVERFGFLQELFDQKISMEEYLQNWSYTKSNIFTNNSNSNNLNSNSNFNNSKLIEIEILMRSQFKANICAESIQKFDYIICPQPRLLPINVDSKLIVIFHDIYSVLTCSATFPQSLIYNKSNCQKIINSSYKIIVNSISTGNDISKTFQNTAIQSTKNQWQKINLLYPALPNLTEIESQKENITEINISLVETNIDGVYSNPYELAQAGQLKYFVDKNLLLIEKDFCPVASGIGIPKNIKYVLGLSGFENRKNWVNLILAHHHLNQNHNWQHHLVLAGSIVDAKYYQKLLDLIQKYNIKNITWVISPSETQKNTLLQNCLFLAYPSFYEGFGFPILEAQRHSKIVLTSRVSSMPEIGKDACLYINPFDYKDIANGFLILTKDPVFAQSLTDNIPKNANSYGWEELQNGLEKILKSSI